MLLEEMIRKGGDHVVFFGDFDDIIVEHEKVGGVSSVTPKIYPTIINGKS